MRYKVRDSKERPLGTLEVPDWKDETIKHALRKMGLSLVADPAWFSFQGEPEHLQVYDRGVQVLDLKLVTCPECGSFEGCDRECPQKRLN